MNNLYLIDCMDFMKDKPDNYYELAIVDPPYGINITDSGWVKSNKKIQTDNEWDNTIPDELYFNELFRVSKNQIIWGGNYFDLPPTKCFLIWDKRIGECCSFAMCEFAWSSFNTSAKIFRDNPMKYGKEKIHPTQKPVKLYKWLLQHYAKEGDKLLDTHSGSGSFRIAAYDMGFDLDSCELDKDYFESNEKRFTEHVKLDKMQGKLF